MKRPRGLRSPSEDHSHGFAPERIATTVDDEGAALAASVLETAERRHGGIEVYSRAKKIALRFETLGGLIPRLKGLGMTFPSMSDVDVFPQDGRTVFFDYPAPGRTGVYERGRVGLDLEATAAPTGPAHRPTFDGVAKWRRWRPEDAMYFFGYALGDYLSLPFSLRSRKLIDARPWGRGAELWFRFPDSSDTHSRVQGFFFDDSGLLVRHDYRAEILGVMFNGAHFSRDYVDVDGLAVATRRTVYAKLWHHPSRLVLPLPVLHARIRPRI